MKGKNKIVILLMILLVGITPVYAQKKSDKLKDQERELKKKIKETNELLSEKKNKERLTLIELAIVNEQLEAQEELIGNMTNQVRRLNQDIAENKSVVESLKLDMVKMKKQYGKMLMYAYKHRNKSHLLLYIFSSKNFNQAFSRVKYVKQFSEYKAEKLKMIRNSQTTLEKKLKQLENKKAEKEGLVIKQTEEKEIYHKNKEQQQVALKEMKKQEAELTKELKKVLQQQTNLQEKINQAIKEEEDKDEVDRLVAKGDKEIKKENYDKAITYYENALKVLPKDKTAKSKLEDAKELKKKNAGKTPVKTVPDKDPVDNDETPEVTIESTNFENNKGKLPWPCEKGSITQSFGKNAHPTVPGIFTNNNGIEIGTSSGAKVRAVFEGKVSKVLVIDGGGKAVIINHGVYRTVYANLKDANVKEGDKVSIKQNIGTLNPGDDNLSELHFEVRFGKERQNPYEWLTKK
jgi:septal ring factor EnvC (AmiA/AmiB activator)